MSRGKRTDVARCSCVMCKKEMSNVGLLTHLLRTHDNDVRFANSGHTNGNPGYVGGNQYTKAKERGETYEIAETTRSKMRVNSSMHNATYWTAENRDKHADAMLAAVISHPDSYNYDNVCRRVKRFEYNGSYLHSSWEVEVAKYLDANNIKWIRKTTSFDYVWENKVRQYFPDFYLPELDVYVEVKGYEVPKDRAKWDQFPKTLIIIKAQQIGEILNGTYKLMGV